MKIRGIFFPRSTNKLAGYAWEPTMCRNGIFYERITRLSAYVPRVYLRSAPTIFANISMAVFRLDVAKLYIHDARCIKRSYRQRARYAPYTVNKR